MPSILYVIPNNYFKLPKRDKIETLSKSLKSEDFSAHELRWTNIIVQVCVAWSYLCLKKVDNLFKNEIYIPLFGK